MAMEFEKTLGVHETDIPGLVVVDLPLHGDARGWFKENWQRTKMEALGVPMIHPVQNNVSYNAARGVTRGIHAEPWNKFVSVATGSVFGAWVDLRPGATFGRVFATVLDPSKAIFVPRGVGNSYQALEDNTAYIYLVDKHWALERKSEYTFVNLADPTLGIAWPIPLEEAVMSAADRTHPLLADAKPMDSLRVLVTGANGQLGRALRALAQRRGFVGWEFASSQDVDITDAAALAARDWDAYGTIINCAAFTAVDAAETPEGRAAAWRVNAQGAFNLSQVASAHDITLVHISTDYVFDGAVEQHTEEEPCAPLGVYGQTKAAGDCAVALVPRHFILRTSWVVGDGKNFVRTMAALSARCALPADDEKHLDHITVVNDQFGRLTFADTLAEAIVHVLGLGETLPAGAAFDGATGTAHAPYGTYNVSNSGSVGSWYDIARAVFRAVNGNEDAVWPVSAAEYYAASTNPVAPRPVHSALVLDKIVRTGFAAPPWEDALTAYLQA